MLRKIFIAFLFTIGFLFADEEPAAESPAVDLPVKTEMKIAEPSLNFQGRLETNYTAGDPTAQGFYLSSFRLGAFGHILPSIDYSFAVGQSRDYTGLYLPQILPVEAYVKLSGDMIFSYPAIQWKIGMFFPSLHPEWSRDLSDCLFPEYLRTQQVLLPYLDIGTELAYESQQQTFLAAVGYFNGNGIQAFNTNNSKLFTGRFQIVEDFDVVKILLGSGAFYFGQSIGGSVNYKSNWAANMYLQLQFFHRRLIAEGDYFIGRYEDISRVVSPTGYAVSVIGYPVEQLGFFTRLEVLNSSPSTNGTMRTLQLGASLDLGRHFKFFFYYNYLEDAGSFTNAGLVKLRVVL